MTSLSSLPIRMLLKLSPSIVGIGNLRFPGSAGDLLQASDPTVARRRHGPNGYGNRAAPNVTRGTWRVVCQIIFNFRAQIARGYSRASPDCSGQHAAACGLSY